MFRTLDNDRDLRGDADAYKDAALKVAQLDAWTATASPLRMRCTDPLFDNKLVFLMPSPVRARQISLQDGESGYIGTLVIQDA
jgi:hypothetical protein